MTIWLVYEFHVDIVENISSQMKHIKHISENFIQNKLLIKRYLTYLTKLIR